MKQWRGYGGYVGIFGLGYWCLPSLAILVNLNFVGSVQKPTLILLVSLSPSPIPPSDTDQQAMHQYQWVT